MKNLFSFLMRFSPGFVLMALVFSTFAGMLNTSLIAIINKSITETVDSPMETMVWSFVTVCVLLLATRVVSAVMISSLTQKAVFELRMRLSAQILAAPLRNLESHGPAKLLATLTTDIGTVSMALSTLPFLSMNAAMFLGCVGYLFWLYWPAGAGVLVASILGVGLYNLVLGLAQKHFRAARVNQDALFENFRALTGGTKELKLHRARKKAFHDEMLHQSGSDYRRNNVMAFVYYNLGTSMAQMMFFIAIGVCIYWLPFTATNIDSEVVTGYTLILLYLIIPLDGLTAVIPQLGNAVIAMNKVQSLGLSVESPDDDENRPIPQPQWSSLTYDNVTHAYHREGEEQTFTLGPINLDLKPGELIFIVGGNGSGKTTLAKLLIGLYQPESGSIKLDGEAVDLNHMDDFRQYFTAIFSDFYLFETLLGMEKVNLDEKVSAYLEKLKLDHKVELVDGAFSTISLSQGQRKRLALLTAYLEDRPIYLFDEWAADQDPWFKEVFYKTLLPELKARNKTVLVISHDDHYFHMADRLIKLDYGQIEYDRDEQAQTMPG